MAYLDLEIICEQGSFSFQFIVKQTLVEFVFTLILAYLYKVDMSHSTVYRRFQICSNLQSSFRITY